MKPDTLSSDDRPLLPPESSAGTSLGRWIVNMVTLALLGVGAYMAYNWLVGDIARRRAVAVNAEVTAPAPMEATHATAPTPPASVPNTSPLVSDSSQGMIAPAVIGGAVNKCVVDGHVTYTNAPCPEAANPPPPPGVTGMDANGVAGSTGSSATTTVAQPVAFSTPGQQQADCNFLVAEVTRLDYEFQQPLPPPVLDHIATRLVDLRSHAEAIQCAVPAARQSAPAKVVDEKVGT
ncbi:hypothetical protein [Ottowia sp.]|uniref:hypothetical protein n=1 Tax=Ottowia sp. TaxID=1898956 RepID=UPI003A876319